mgnify:CR=1 FL=1
MRELSIKVFKAMLKETLSTLKGYHMTLKLRDGLKALLHERLPDNVWFVFVDDGDEMSANKELIEVKVEYDYAKKSIKSVRTFLRGE